MPHAPAPRDDRERAFLDKAASAIRVVRITRRTHPNSAASRAYYAVHNAMNGRNGPTFPHDHASIAHPRVLAALGLDRAAAEEIQWLYKLRHRADYSSEGVDAGAAEILLLRAEEILSRLGIDFS